MTSTLVRFRALFAAIAAAASLSVAATGFALETGTPAPEIDLVGTDGERIRMSDLRGKVVVVDFWASWCGPCRESFPFLERMQQRHRARGLVVVGVSVDSEDAEFRRFVDAHPVNFRLARDANHQVARRYAPPSMPTSYIIDRSGVVRYVQRGYRRAHDAAFERELLRHLEQPTP